MGDKCTVSAALEWAIRLLTDAGVDETRLNAETMLAHVLEVNRDRFFLKSDLVVGREPFFAFQAMVRRRAGREPLQYIIGETEFMGLRFFVDPAVLIPRPETEHLVETALRIAREMNRELVKALDIGTGSGNIAIALAILYPTIHVTAVDVSPATLEVALRNVNLHRADNVTLLHKDIFSDLLNGSRYDLIVSNPPYIAREAFPDLQQEVRLFEPRIATTDDADGFKFLKRILALSGKLLNTGGAVCVELGFGQEEEAVRLAESEGYGMIVVHKDYAGIPRVLEAHRNATSV